MFAPKPSKRMCKSKSAVATSSPSTPASAAARSNHRSPRAATTASTPFPPAASSSYSHSSSTASSSAASLALLRDSLPELPLLLTYHDLAAATASFSSSHRLAPNSANSFRCTLRSRPAAVFRRPLRRDARHVSARLAALGHCHHAAVARLLGAAASPDRATLFLAYELVPDAAPLSALLRNPNNPSFTPLASWHGRLQIAAHVCDALHYVHLQAGTVHSRLSASSVLVCGEGPLFRAKIAHFGAADLAGEIPLPSEQGEEDGHHRRSGSRGRRIEGTRGYMAPEIIAGAPPSRRSDVFALGVVLLELLSGKEPVRYDLRPNGEYERTSLIEAAAAAAGGGDEMRRWVDGRLKDSFPVEAAESLTLLALHCVAKDPAARPDMSWVAAKVSKLFLEAHDWAAKFSMPTDISVSMAPR